MANTSATFTFTINGVQESIKNFNDLNTAIQLIEEELHSTAFDSDTFEPLQKELAKAKAALADFNKSTDQTGEAAEKAGKNAKEMGGQFSDAFGLASIAGGETGEAIEKVKGIVDSFTGIVKKLAGSFATTLKGAIASTGVGALLIAFGLLVTYFTESQEGMNKLKQATAALGAVFNLIKDVAIDLGKKLFDALSNPKKAVTDLGKLIEENLINRVKAFAVIFNALKDGDLGKLGDGVVQLGTGITDASTKMKGLVSDTQDFIDKANQAAKAAMEISASNQQIAKEERELNVERAKSRARLEELKKNSDDVTKSAKVRAADAKEAGTTEEALLNKQLALQDRKIANLKAEQALKKNLTSEDKQDLADLEIERANVAQESFQKQTEVQNKLNAINLEAQAKRLADLQAERAASYAINKQKLDDSLKLATVGTSEYQKIQVKQIELERDNARQLIKDRLALTGQNAAGPKEKAALKQQLTELNETAKIAKKQLDEDFYKDQDTRTAQHEKNLADIQVAGLQEGSKLYYFALGQQLEANEKLAIAQVNQSKKTETEKQDAILAIQTKGIADRKALTDSENAAAAAHEKLLADTKVAGLREGTAKYFAALVEQLDAQEKVDIQAVQATKKTEQEKQDEITLIQKKAAAQRKELVKSEVKAASQVNIGTSILKKVFGVDDDKLEETKAALASAFQFGIEAATSALAQASAARLAALDAQEAQVDDFLDKAKTASDDLKSQLDESDSRIHDLEGQLKNTRGAERQAVIDSLEKERAMNHQIATEKAKEDARIKAAEQQKIQLEKQKTAEQEKQQQIQGALNALQAVSAAIGATEAAVASVKAIAKASEGGHFGFDNIAYILAATVAMGAAFVAVKSAAKGFAEGGYTGAGDHAVDHTGFRVAGVVHEGEWVAPKWMVESPKFQSTIGQLEAARTTGAGFATGGYVPVSNNGGVDLSVLNQLQAQMNDLRRDTNVLAARDVYVATTTYENHQANNAKIQNYFLNQ